MKGQPQTQSRPVRTRRAPQASQQEKEEIREYLAKLRQIVPSCPKDGRLSRLELIQYVIDYIVQLQDTLVHHPVTRLLSEGGNVPTDGIPPMPGTPPLSPLCHSPSTAAALLTIHRQLAAGSPAATELRCSDSTNTYYNSYSGNPTPVEVDPAAFAATLAAGMTHGSAQPHSRNGKGSCRKPLRVLTPLNQNNM